MVGYGGEEYQKHENHYRRVEVGKHVVRIKCKRFRRYDVELEKVKQRDERDEYLSSGLRNDSGDDGCGCLQRLARDARTR